MIAKQIVILGEGGVGKSALTLQFVAEQFVEAYDPTIEDSYKKLVTVDEQKINLELLDTAGTEQFTSLHSLYLRTGDAFLLVFSLTSIDSVNALTEVRQQILRVKDADGVKEVRVGYLPRRRLIDDQKDVAIVLCGNKCDLNAERTVPRDVGVALSGLWNGVPYYETSARKRINVEQVFEDAIRQILRRDQANRGNSPTTTRDPHRRKRKARCVIC